MRAQPMSATAPTLTSTPASPSTSTAPLPVALPPAPPQTHCPASRHLNRPRAINMVDDAVSTGILHLDVNESPEEAQQSASALLDNVILQAWYQDDLSSYAEKDIKKAMLNEFQQLQQQHVGTPVNKNNPTDKQRRSIIDTRWDISERPPSSSSSSENNFEGSLREGLTWRPMLQHHLFRAYVFSLSTASSTTGK